MVIKKPLIFIWQKTFHYILAPLYKIYRSAKNIILSNPNFEKNRFRFLFVNKYVVYVVVFIILTIVTSANINAAGVRQENYGKQSIVYSLITPELESYIVEEATTVYQPNTDTDGKSLLDSSTNVISQNSMISGEGQLIGNEEYITSPGLAYGSGVASITSDTSLADRTDVEYHVVQAGETISEIADRYDISVDTILWENKIGTKDYIKPGQKLTILPTSGTAHRIKSGDTIASIAKKYEADTAEIIEYNHLAAADDIEVGEVLVIPDGEIEEVIIIVPTTQSTGSLRSNFSNSVPSSAAPSYSTKLQWPTTSHKISQYFSWRHTGLDIDGETGDPLYAAESGTVTAVGWNGGYGLRIVVNHGGGMQTLYAHCSQTYVTAGQSVSRGQTIGLQGNTGWSTGPHLHFEVIVNGGKYNPLNYLR